MAATSKTPWLRTCFASGSSASLTCAATASPSRHSSPPGPARSWPTCSSTVTPPSRATGSRSGSGRTRPSRRRSPTCATCCTACAAAWPTPIASSRRPRKPWGPGWALVGDAGYHRDPITAQGISDAFRDAELLAEAIDAGLSVRRPLDQALGDYERRRDEAVRPMYELTYQFASLQPPPPETQQLIGALRHDQAQTDRFLGTIAGSVPIPEFYAPENLGRIMAAAAQPAPA